MAIKTYVDGGKQAITFNNDTQPVAVYVDGDLQENVSFVPDTVQGTGSVEYTSEYKKNHIEYEVQGTTIQDGTPTPEAPIPIENANDDGMSAVLRGENLFNAQGEISSIANGANFSFGNNFIKKINVNSAASDSVMFAKEYPAGIYTLSLKTEYSKTGGYTIRFLSNKSYEGGVYNSYYKAYYKDIVTQADPNTSFTVTLGENAMIGFAIAANNAFGTMDITDIMLTPTSQAVEYKPYVEKTIEIPTEITSTVDKPILNKGVALADGKSVPLLFTEYDKLTVNRVNNEVKYYEGGVIHTLTGNETTFTTVSGNGNNYRVYFNSIGISGNFVYNVGSCSHFVKAMWAPLSKQGTYATRNSDIIFRTDGVQTRDEFKAFLAEQYANGTPVKFIIQRQTLIEHDITNTDLGQALLNLDTQNQTNYFEITSNENAPQTPINFTFAKWGGRNENNNNT